MAEPTMRYAVVTGANKGLGFGIAQLLASKGVMVVLTSRDEQRGLQAVERLKQSGFSDLIIFHQLDVTDTCSIASLANFVKNQFGKLDILVNNAGIGGTTVDYDALKSMVPPAAIEEEILKFWNSVTTQSYELAEKCLNTNYYGAKRTTEALIPLLHLSDSPRIVNISSSMGQLQKIPNEWAKGVMGDMENPSEERMEEVLNKFLEDFKNGSLETENWPPFASAYIMSKTALNAHTRIMAKKYPNFCINCIDPGYLKTDMTSNMGILSIEEAAVHPVNLALLPSGGPSGLSFCMNQVSSF